MTDHDHPNSGERLSVASGAPGLSGGDVLDRFLAQVADDGGAAAVLESDRVWSYAELDDLAQRIAATLADRLRPGAVVGVHLEKSAALVAVAVALARLGAVYLPLGTSGRRWQSLRQAGWIDCHLGPPDLLPDLATAHPVPGLADSVPGVMALVDEEPAKPLPAGTQYAIMTSGSTGAPKLVAVGSRSLANVTSWYAQTFELTVGQRHSLFMNPAFDPHLLELWATLGSGATLVVPPRHVRADPFALTSWWAQSALTVTNLPTPLAELVLEAPWPALPALRHLIIGGDRLRRRPDRAVTAAVHNLYGPAEATVVTTAHPISDADPDDAAPPIGLPIAGASVWVVDEQGQPVRRRHSGELCIGGDVLALAVLSPTGESSFADGPTPVAGLDRCYRTGDQVRMRPDGVLEFLGRLDGQLKINGVRVEPAELEAAFERDERVGRAVLTTTAPDGGRRLTMHVQPVSGASPDPGQLAEAARSWLPAAVSPPRVRVVTVLPLTDNGKIDKDALVAATPSVGLDVAADLNPNEQLILRLCQDLLGLEQVAPGDRFADLGGDSLATARLLSAIEHRTGVRLRATAVLRQPDLRSIAALLS